MAAGGQVAQQENISVETIKTRLTSAQHRVVWAANARPATRGARKLEDRLSRKLATLADTVDTISTREPEKTVSRVDPSDLKLLSLLALAQRGTELENPLRFLRITSPETRHTLAKAIEQTAQDLLSQGIELPTFGIRKVVPPWPRAGETFTACMLTPGERLVLDGMRAWVMAIRNDQEPVAATEAQFGRGNMHPGVLALSDILVATATGASRPVEIRCEGNPMLSVDEARVIAAIEACQHDRIHEARRYLRHWLSEPSLPMALKGAVNLGDTLAASSLSLPERAWDF